MILNIIAALVGCGIVWGLSVLGAKAYYKRTGDSGEPQNDVPIMIIKGYGRNSNGQDDAIIRSHQIQECIDKQVYEKKRNQ